ncbi:MAG: diguanylate cyclase [Phycisphaerae bacterium]
MNLSQTTCGLAALVAALVAGGTAWRLVERDATAAQLQRRAAAAEPLLSFVLAAGAGGSRPLTPEDHAALARLAEASQAVRWVALVRADGSVLELRQKFDVPRVELLRLVGADRTRVRWHAQRVQTAVGSHDLHALVIPLGEDRGALAALVETPAATDATASALHIPAAGIASAGLAVASALLYAGVVRPNRRLRVRAAAVRDELFALAGRDARAGAAEPVAALEELRGAMKQALRDASALRRAVDTRVETRTRQAEDALRSADRDAHTDALTRLPNRRALERELPRAFDEHHTAGGELSVVVVDVNNLKTLNDEVGHSAGDDLIAGVGEVLRAALDRQKHFAARYGGDEFVLVLSNTNVGDALALVQRVHKLFIQRTRKYARLRRPPGLAVGVAALRRHAARSSEHLLRLADEAMYQAKRGGRAVVAAHELPEARPASVP